MPNPAPSQVPPPCQRLGGRTGRPRAGWWAAAAALIVSVAGGLPLWRSASTGSDTVAAVAGEVGKRRPGQAEDGLVLVPPVRKEVEVAAALEILVFTTAIANLVREGKTHQIPGMIQVGKKLGNQPLDDAILEHLRMKRISPEEAYDKAIDKKKFRTFLPHPPEEDET